MFPRFLVSLLKKVSKATTISIYELIKDIVTNFVK